VSGTEDTYQAALRMLAGRELSEAQVRQRLARRQHDQGSIDAAIIRLKADGSLDDARAARAIAHSHTTLRKRGKVRVTREIEAAGIASSIARRAVDEAFAGLDVDALLSAALARRLRGDARIADDKEFQRLYRYLLTQGFEADQILATLRKRTGSR
jgi:regulatory protein